jgi:hypothetical protein
MSMPQTICSCSHPVDCNHECHGRHCDPTEHICSIEFLPDEGGLAPWGCADCTPGEGIPHLDDCTSLEPMRAGIGSETVVQPNAPLS